MRVNSFSTSAAAAVASIMVLGCNNNDVNDLLEGNESVVEQKVDVVCPGTDENPDAGMMEEPPTSEPVAAINFDAVYVVNGGDGMDASISVIDAGTNTVARTIALMGAMWPHHVYLNADRSKLAVAVPGMDMSMGHEMGEQDMPGAAMILDARTGATLASTLLPAMNHNVIFAPNQREVWTSQMMMGGMVLVLDARTLTTLNEIEVGDMPAEVTFSPNGSQAWVTNTMSNTVNVINPSTKAVVATIPVGEVPVVPSQGSNGLVYVDNEEGQTVSVITRRDRRVVSTINLGFMPGMAAPGPDGHLWVTDPDEAKVVLFSLDRGQRQHEIALQDGSHAVAFSSDGRWAYITNQMAASVSVVDVHRLRVVRTVCVGNKPNGLLFRPRG